MSLSSSYCRRAVAYLKVAAPLGGQPELLLSKRDSPVIRSLGHGLLVAYVVHEGEEFSYLLQHHLDEAGLSLDALHSIALENLRVIAENHVEVRTYGNVYAVLMGGNFEASLILLTEFWSEWYAELTPSGVVAAFPARDILAFGDAASPEARRELVTICERAVEGKVDHPLTSSLFRREGDRWTPIGGVE